MTGRFEGKEGKRRLAKVLASQELVLNDRQLAKKLSRIVRLDSYKKGQEIYVQGEPGKNQIYFIVNGKFELLAQGNHIAFKGRGEAVGEFPILDPSLSYTVTVRALEEGLVARLSEEQFQKIADDHPEIWKNMTKMLVSRLRHSNEMFPWPKSPCVFIGHGRSELWVRLQSFLEDNLGLQTVAFESEPRSGLSIVEILRKMLGQATFAVLILTGEDATAEGGKRARQNVIHEAGLFQGVLGFHRAVMLVQKGAEELSNVAGLQNIMFEGEKIEQGFGELQRTLKREGLLKN